MASNWQQRIGRWGEKAAEEYLIRQGCRIIDRNVRTEYGELDLVIRHGDEIAFVEVKTRTGAAFGLPEEAITDNKRIHLVEAAQAYLQEHPGLGESWRVDVIAVQGKPGKGTPRVVWFENAVS